ncbi:anthranilate synthase component 1 [Breznakibacter xylanolyticus]|uniref:Anthranilate synthase component 1 n=1 Tax=Breznakibacter xylanolyticus TaxID=990 RepID=A0A2W7NAC3_9BACT|nr:anthranilate synthase component I family protein [Breznakibacter xylanolyticus]PZX17395.1 anthranilate synthase component 1 [Breznakibacter xylanolyticus]
MKIVQINPLCTKLSPGVSDVITPVSIYMKMRDIYPNTILLESSDYHGNRNSMSFICFQADGEFKVQNGTVTRQMPGEEAETFVPASPQEVPMLLDGYVRSFQVQNNHLPVKINGLFGYSAYDAVQYFETIRLKTPRKDEYSIPDLRYVFYRNTIAINHFTNQMYLIENLHNGHESQFRWVMNVLHNPNNPDFKFVPSTEEKSNVTNEQFIEMVKKGKEHCFKGDVFQIVLSRQFSRGFTGDEFNVYRALRNINPSPYLFFFDYGDYKIFGSSPEAQLVIDDGVATINPIAGTFKRTGDDLKDKELAVKLSLDPKENAEHVMLVDLARNDLSRNCNQVKVHTFKEVQYYSHVLHLVSDVKGQLKAGSNTCRIMADTFPAGTLSGAPKFKAMELIDAYENQHRSFYGGCIGYLGFDGNFNQAITIRTFLSKNNTLFYQAGAGVVSQSDEESELNEVNNKLGALKKAVEMAAEF